MRHARLSDRSLGTVTIILVVAFVLACFTGILYRLTHPTGERREITAEFANVQQLREGDEVRLAGIRVGAVKRIEPAQDERATRVTLEVDEDAGPLYRDAVASVNWRLLLGSNFYVDLDRGSRQAGDLGDATIQARRTSGQVELEDVLSVTRGDARSGLRRLPKELADAFGDQQALPRALTALADGSGGIAQGANGLRGQDEDVDLRSMIRNVERVSRAMTSPTRDLQRLVSGAAATVQTTGARAADIRTTLAAAPGVLDRADVTLDRLRHTLTTIDPVLDRLQAPAPEVAPTLRALQPTLVGADRLLGRARPLLRSLRPAVASLAAAARDGGPLVESILPALDRLDDVILPYLGEIDPMTGKSTSVMIGGTLAGLGPGASGQKDGNGHMIRFPATAGNNSLYLPCGTFVNDPTQSQIVACKTLEESFNTLLAYDPFGPPPGVEP